MRTLIRSRCAFLILLHHLLLVPCPALLGQDAWVEDSFEDFRDGTFDASGQNLFVTAQGRIRTIHRFDLNQDGHLDVVFCSSHDVMHSPKPTLLTHRAGRGAGDIGRLAMAGSVCGAAADMNKDGFLDLVLCPNQNGISHRRYARVFWGGADGWVRQRTTTLATNIARAVQIADVDGDGWPDVLVLNGQRWSEQEGGEAMLRIYWGSDESFRHEQHRDVLLGHARDMVVTDLDGDDRPDIAILQQSNAKEAAADKREAPGDEVVIYWNDAIGRSGSLAPPQRVDLKTGSVRGLDLVDFDIDGRRDLVISGGKKTLVRVDPTTKQEKHTYAGLACIRATGKRQWGAPIRFETPSLSALDLGDLNGDGRIDAVLCKSDLDTDSIQIMWGRSDGGFDDDVTPLDLPRITSVAIADLDGDGKPDIVASPWRGEQVHESSSRIFYGNGRGDFEMADIEIPTAGVASIITAPTDDDDGTRVVFCNTSGGRVYEDVPVLVYWGGRDGFDPKRRRAYPNVAGNFANGADLDDDGHPELILGACVHAEAADNPDLGFSIYGGGPDGPSLDHRTILYEYGLAGTNVADFNRDGYLDLIATCNKATRDGEPTRAVVRYGGPDGFDARTVIAWEGVIWSNVVADFNRDGWLDFAASMLDRNRLGILWGGPEGFSAERMTTIPFMQSDNLRVADLNADGWLDLIATSYKVAGTFHHDYGTRIFWGSPEGFSPFNAQQLRGYAAFGISVADYDADGHLDLHVPNYKMRQIRDSISSFLYWGSAEGYSNDNFTPLLQDSGTGTQSGDYNGDGLIDIAIACHTRGGSHHTSSRIYYNDGHRFTSPRCQLLPTLGPHNMMNADVGNQYDRRYRQTYVSSVRTWQAERTRGRLTHRAEMPGRSRLTFSVRSAPVEAQLEAAPWREAGETGFLLDRRDRCMQYHAVFLSDNGDRYPILDRVTIQFR